MPAVEGLAASPNNGSSQFAISESGTIIYLTGSGDAAGRQLMWLLRGSKTQLLHPAPSTYVNPRFSLDGNQIAFDQLQDQFDVWTYDLKRQAPSRLTFEPGLDRRPVWTNDARRIVFATQRGDKATYNLYWQRADGTGEPQRLPDSKYAQFPMSWHPNGKILAFAEVTPETNPPSIPTPHHHRWEASRNESRLFRPTAAGSPITPMRAEATTKVLSAHFRDPAVSGKSRPVAANFPCGRETDGSSSIEAPIRKLWSFLIRLTEILSVLPSLSCGPIFSSLRSAPSTVPSISILTASDLLH